MCACVRIGIDLATEYPPERYPHPDYYMKVLEKSTVTPTCLRQSRAKSTTVHNPDVDYFRLGPFQGTARSLERGMRQIQRVFQAITIIQ